MMNRLISLIALISLVLGLVIWAKYTVAYTKIGSDFTQDYIAATALSEGTPIYGENIVRLSIERLGFEEHENYHPPTTALIFLPLSYLPYPTAVIVWNSLNLVLYVATILMILNTLPFNKSHRLPIVSLLLLWFPFISNIGLVQISLLLVYLVALSWKLTKEDRNIGAGVALGLAALIKLFPGYLALYFILTRNFKAFIAMSVTVLCGLAAAYICVGHDNFFTYLLVKMPEDSERFATFLLNGSLPSVISSMFSNNAWTTPIFHTDSHQLIGIVLGVGLTLFTLIILSKSHTTTADEKFAILTIAMMIVSPITWIHVMPLALIPIALLITEPRSEGRLELRVALLALALFSIPDVPLANYLHNLYLPNLVPWSVAIATKFTFIGLALIYWSFLRRIRDAQSHLG